MNFFSIRTNEQETIRRILNKDPKINFGTLSWHKDEVSIGDFVFIVISGDEAKKKLDYENGLRALGTIVGLPVAEGTHFAIEVEIHKLLQRSYTKEDFYPFPSLKDAPNIGPDTKRPPNQAFRLIDENTAKDILQALAEIGGNEIQLDDFKNLKFSRRIEKLISNTFCEIRLDEKDIVCQFIIKAFIEWFNKKENFKPSYQGLINEKVLKSWDLVFFNNRLFVIDTNNVESSLQNIERLILDGSNIDWINYSNYSSRGAPAAILGRENYLKFLTASIKDEKFLNNLKMYLASKGIHASSEQGKFSFKEFQTAVKKCGLFLSEKVIIRMFSSLFTKPFIILTGLSGSGKTKLAQAFVEWICESQEQYRIIPVGADWTNREPLLGYPDGLREKEYVMPDSGALQIMINAVKPGNENKPYFLILDEMNLSHVERYFADFLSVMESRKNIKLYDGPERKNNDAPIPHEIPWPPNLFIIGTVNVDETTYMFSPKVLDRANVIEFRVEKNEMEEFLRKSSDVRMEKLHADDIADNPGLGAGMAADFLRMAWSRTTSTKAEHALIGFFPVLQKAGAEFGYRSASEINRLAGILEKLLEGKTEWDGNPISENDFIDIAVMQKLLPKLHGSRTRLVPVLASLGRLCLDSAKKSYPDTDDGAKSFIKECLDEIPPSECIKYRVSFDKIRRMYHNVIANGFTSYAEN